MALQNKILSLFLILLLSGLLLNCGTNRKTIYELLSDPKKPDLFLEFFDQDDQQTIWQPTIELRSYDSSHVGDVFNTFAIYDINSDSVYLHITHENYLPLDTSLKIIADSTQLIRIGLKYRVLATGKPGRDSQYYMDGWNDAAKDITEENAGWYRSGGLSRDFIKWDATYGLPIRGNWSSIVIEEWNTYSLGYNDRVNLYIYNNGLPKNSKKKWADIIINPKQSFKKIKKQSGSVTLVIGRDSVISQDERFVIRVIEENSDDYSGNALEIKNQITGMIKKGNIWIDKNRPKVEAVFGPDQSELLLIKSGKDYFVYDIRQCELYNME